MQKSKTAILESLDKMDNRQAEKALVYIKSLLESNEKYSYNYLKLKQRALSEIRTALRNDKIGMPF